MSTSVLKALPGKLDIKRHSPSILYISASLAMSTSVLKALPGKLDIKRHSPSILYFQVNLIILQAQESNYCDRCLVKPTNCRKVSGTFGITVMSKGYNPVVDIPVGACFINVTEIGRSQNYLGKIKQVPSLSLSLSLSLSVCPSLSIDLCLSVCLSVSLSLL